MITIEKIIEEAFNVFLIMALITICGLIGLTIGSIFGTLLGLVEPNHSTFIHNYGLFSGLIMGLLYGSYQAYQINKMKEHKYLNTLNSIKVNK